MGRRISAREDLRLRSVNGLSQNAIACTAESRGRASGTQARPRGSIASSGRTSRGVRESGLSAVVPNRDDAGTVHADPSGARVRGEFVSTDVTLKLLHAEDAEGCAIWPARLRRPPVPGG